MRIKFFIFVIGLFSGVMGANIYYHRQNRIQLGRITELESELTSRQQELKECNSRLSEVSTILEDNNRRAEQFVDKMGEQLERDLSTVKDTTGLLRILREQIQELKSFYTCTRDNIISYGDTDRE